MPDKEPMTTKALLDSVGKLLADIFAEQHRHSHEMDALSSRARALQVQLLEMQIREKSAEEAAPPARGSEEKR
jgi:hypothetical protein